MNSLSVVSDNKDQLHAAGFERNECIWDLAQRHGPLGGSAGSRRMTPSVDFSFRLALRFLKKHHVDEISKTYMWAGRSS